MKRYRSFWWSRQSERPLMPGSAWLMAIVAVIYAGTTVALLMENQPYKALMFAGYVLAQIGLVLDVSRPL